MADLKAIQMLAGGRTAAKPKLSLLPRTGIIYATRAIEYGVDKYARGNYHAPPPAGLDGDPQRAAALRLLGYLDAAMRHASAVSDALNRALATGGDLAAAAGALDVDASGGFPPSMLPDFCGALASLLIGVTCAADDGLIPADPGQPWKPLMVKPSEDSAIEARKADPAAERARAEVAACGVPSGVQL